MRRILLLAIGALSLALAVPGVASAHHGHGRHHRHHHHAQAHHARLEHFNAPANTDPSNPSAPADAGTVTSFTNGVLTITLADGSTVSGKVTSDTEINCMGPNAQASRDGGGDQSQGDQSQGDQSQGDQSQGDQSQGDQNGSGDQGDDNGSGDDQGDQQSQAPTCDTTSLTAGTPVHEAILKIGSNGAEFKLVLLDAQQQQQQAGS